MTEPSDEYHQWLIKTSHADLYMAWQAGEESMKQKVAYMLEQRLLLHADPSVSKIAQAVREL